MSKPDMSFITVGMNHLKYLPKLYGSMYGTAAKSRPYTFEAVYVDNCSTDGSVDWLKENYPQVKIICNTEKLGFAANNNKGVMASVGGWIGIINPDIVFRENSMEEIMKFHQYNGGGESLSLNF